MPNVIVYVQRNILQSNNILKYFKRHANVLSYIEKSVWNLSEFYRNRLKKLNMVSGSRDIEEERMVLLHTRGQCKI